MAIAAWALWLAVPVAVTVLAAVWTWIRGRPPRQPSTAKAVRQHAEYLDTLAATARRIIDDADGATAAEEASRTRSRD